MADNTFRAEIPILEPLPDEGVYVLRNDVTYWCGNMVHGIAAGFKTDGASIPRFAWLTTGTPFEPAHLRAALLHDFLYQTQPVLRQTADALFREWLRIDGVSTYQRWKMWLALRAFGWVAWNRYRKKGSRHGNV